MLGVDIVCQDPVHACRMAKAYLAALLDRLADPEVRRALAGPSALFAPPLILAASLSKSEGDLRRLLQDLRPALVRLEGDLGELVRKHDYRFRHEGLTEDQAASWLRALEVLSGRDPQEVRARFQPRRDITRFRPAP
ncbi:MAG: hypothetical protein RMM30_08960 [Armatimonadota bacterium]|nr:hypothetical protein [Armatimonadota bacterium]MDW8156698.1 hypothetical protein [Armatimonadota bacterium]